MASTYSTNLKLELMATGEQSGQWGNKTNTNLGTLIEQAIVGYTTQAILDVGDTTITIADGASSAARNYVLELTGALTNNRNLIVPAIQKPYVIYNNTTGGYSVTVKVSGQTGVTVANGKKAIVYNNGTDVIEVANAPVTETGTQTLTNKTLTSPTITGGTINNTSVGVGTPAAGSFTTLAASGAVSGSGFSTYLASPPAIGGSSPAAGSFTTLSASSTVSGNGFSTYLASPPPIGSTLASTGAFTTLSASSTVSGNGFSSYLASPPAIGSNTPSSGAFTTLSMTGNLLISGSAGTTGQSLISAGSGSPPTWGSSIVSGTVVTASGTAVDFTGIPSWAKRVTVMFASVSTTGTVDVIVQLGSSTIQTSGYVAQSWAGGSGNVGRTITSGFPIDSGSEGSTDSRHGALVLVNMTGNVWVGFGNVGRGVSDAVNALSGSVTLSGALDRLRITTSTGIQTFDAGTINIVYE